MPQDPVFDPRRPDAPAQAASAKERGNAAFAKKTREGYQEAAREYTEGIAFTPHNQILYANRCACHLELAADEYEPKRKLKAVARALNDARTCTDRGRHG